MTHTAADVLIEVLADWGVEVVFGLPGDGINGIMDFSSSDMFGSRGKLFTDKRRTATFIPSAALGLSAGIEKKP
jgi:hypothetical protein